MKNKIESAKHLARHLRAGQRRARHHGDQHPIDLGGIDVPFKKSADEVATVKAVASAQSSGKSENYIGNLKFPKIESHRAVRLLKDELSFLAEDLYDTNTYRPTHEQNHRTSRLSVSFRTLVHRLRNHGKLGMRRE